MLFACPANFKRAKTEAHTCLDFSHKKGRTHSHFQLTDRKKGENYSPNSLKAPRPCLSYKTFCTHCETQTTLLPQNAIFPRHLLPPPLPLERNIFPPSPLSPSSELHMLCRTGESFWRIFPPPTPSRTKNTSEKHFSSLPSSSFFYARRFFAGEEE